MFKKILILVMFLVPFSFYGKDIALSAPVKKLNVDLIDAINSRVSSRVFVKKEIPVNELSTILWAGNGMRMDVDAATSASKALRTIPYSGDNAYINIYLFTDSGAYLYEPDKKNLKEISAKNSRALITPENIDAAYGSILFTFDNAKFPAFLKKNPSGVLMPHANAGFAAQNILLASAGLKIGGVIMYNIKPKEISEILKLKADETPLFIIQFGYTK